jgi:ribosomal protein S18 acetylase RimI-like enzyme
MPAEFQIRPCQDRDKQDVIALWNEAFPGNSPWNIPEEDIERKSKMQSELFLVAELNGKIAGTAMGGYDGHRGWVYYVAVIKKHRRKGIGRSLMMRLEADLKAMGCPKLNLQVRSSNQDAVEFYRRLGYAVEDRVSMGKLL